MLWNPKFDKQVTADPLSLDSLIAWLEQQPGETTYDWWDINGCLLCNYLRATFGVERPAAQSWNGELGMGPNTLGRNWGYHKIAKTEPWTYSAALSRARALRDAQSK